MIVSIKDNPRGGFTIPAICSACGEDCFVCIISDLKPFLEYNILRFRYQYKPITEYASIGPQDGIYIACSKKCETFLVLQGHEYDA